MRSIFFLTCAVLWASLCNAQDITPSKVRAAIIARDFEKVDHLLETAQADYLAGNRDADNIRALYITLSRSHPAAVQFVSDWLEKDPENHKAQISRAWSLYNAANYVQWGRNTYSNEVAHHMHRQIFDLVAAAYRSSPDLIPVSDAVVRELGRNNFGIPSSLEAFDLVMKERPNWGTLQRTLPTVYHLSFEMIMSFCKSASENFPTRYMQRIIEHRCILKAANQSKSSDLRAKATKLLWKIEDPALVMDQLDFLIRTKTYQDWTKKEIAWAKAQLLTAPVDQFELAHFRFLAERLAFIARTSHGDRDPFFERFRWARLDQAKAFLDHDPYNLDLLELIDGVEFGQKVATETDADNQTSHRLVPNHLTKEQRHARDSQNDDFAMRRLRASPYSPYHWAKVATIVSKRNIPESTFSGDLAMRNSIVFSDDPAASLLQMMRYKLNQYQTYSKASDISAEDLARLPNWRRFLQQTNLADQILCPYLRAYLLYQASCEHYSPGAEQCRELRGEEATAHASLSELANNEPACAGYLNSSIEELWYDPASFAEATEQLE